MCVGVRRCSAQQEASVVEDPVSEQSKLSLDERDEEDDSGESDHAIDEMMTPDQRCVLYGVLHPPAARKH